MKELSFHKTSPTRPSHKGRGAFEPMTWETRAPDGTIAPPLPGSTARGRPSTFARRLVFDSFASGEIAKNAPWIWRMGGGVCGNHRGPSKGAKAGQLCSARGILHFVRDLETRLKAKAAKRGLLLGKRS